MGKPRAAAAAAAAETATAGDVPKYLAAIKKSEVCLASLSCTYGATVFSVLVTLLTKLIITDNINNNDNWQMFCEC